MKGRTAGFLMFACVGLAAAGCYAGTVLVQPKQVQEENSTKREQFAESSELKAPSADTEEAVRPNPEKEAEYLSGQAEASEKLPEDIEGTQETQEEDAETEVQESSEEQVQKTGTRPFREGAEGNAYSRGPDGRYGKRRDQAPSVGRSHSKDIQPVRCSAGRYRWIYSLPERGDHGGQICRICRG